MENLLSRMKNFVIGTRPYGQNKLVYIIKRVMCMGCFISAIQYSLQFVYFMIREPGPNVLSLIFPAIVATGLYFFLDS
ncbi:MAG TPA: hypothetical protein IAB23_07920 [Candidatus Scybalocola faecavium]|nr:hypothetical protein [Candidatus Scybalocola faecavium]